MKHHMSENSKRMMKIPYHILIAFACLTIIVFLLYHEGAYGPYMLDDFHSIAANTKLKLESLSIQPISDAIFSLKSGPLYRPVSMLSFALNYYFSGNVDGYPIKLVNIIIHIITGGGVFWLTLLLLRRLGNNTGLTEDEKGEVRWTGYTALFIAAIWLLHPLYVSTVLYTVQRMTELSTMFSFYAAIAYIIGRNNLIKGKKSGFWWVLGAVSIGSALAVLSKESGALLPMLLLVIESVFFRFTFHPDISKSSRYLNYGILIVPTIGVFLYLFGVIISKPGGESFREFTLFQRLLTECRAIFFYIRLILLPDISLMGLSHDDFRRSLSLFSPLSTLFAVSGIIGLSAVSIYGALINRYRVLSFAILWFLAGHLLESTVIQLELVFEHRNYLPGFGLIFAAGYYISHLLYRSSRLTKSIKYAIPLIILILLAIPLKLRIGHWSLASKFYINELKNHPESARSIAGLAYQQRLIKQYPKAIESYQMAARLKPDETGYLLAGLDLILFKMHGVPRAEFISMIEQALAIHKITPYTAVQLFTIAGNSLSMDERSAAASRAIADRLLLAAISNTRPWPVDDNVGEAYFLLGEMRFRQNRLEEAAAALEKTVILMPAKHDARLALARIYIILNKIAEAEEHLMRLEDTSIDQSRQRTLLELKQGLVNLKNRSGNL